jgi:hypothetical protein
MVEQELLLFSMINVFMLSHDYLSLCHERRSRSDVNDENDDARNDGTSDGGSLNVLIIKNMKIDYYIKKIFQRKQNILLTLANEKPQANHLRCG